MSAPTPVEIIRPRRTSGEKWAYVLGYIGLNYFFDAWALMVLIPTITHWHPDYWQTLAGIVIVRTLQVGTAPLDFWSKERKS